MSTSTIPKAPSRSRKVLFTVTMLSFLFFYLVFHSHYYFLSSYTLSTTTNTATTLRHLVFAIASSSHTFSRRTEYIRLWYNPTTVRAYVFLDEKNDSLSSPSATAGYCLPPIFLYSNTSHFPYTFMWGQRFRYAIRIAHIVKDVVDHVGDDSDIRWFVFGDDDTVFFTENVMATLSKYDHEQWYYVGMNSEHHSMNAHNYFGMAFGGGGFAVSRSLARVLARALDSCLVRYPHLFGSDARIYACVAELGIDLTREPGFHQVDLKGDLIGLLSAHPLSPLVSLHHLELAEPIFPNKTKPEALKHLFKAVIVDSQRILQQTVCYDRLNSLTVSIAWGYAIQVYDGNQLLLDILSPEKTFEPAWDSNNVAYTFNVRDKAEDPCERPTVFFFESVNSVDNNGAWTEYKKHSNVVRNCSRNIWAENYLDKILVFSPKLSVEVGRVKRRQCCDVLPSFNGSMIASIRRCGNDELISMHS